MQKTADTHGQNAEQATNTGNQLEANGNGAAAAPYFQLAGQEEEQQQIALNKLALSQSPVSTFKSTYNDSIDSGGGFSGGGGGGWSGGAMEITPLPIDDYVGRLHSDLAANPRLAAGLSQPNVNDTPEMPAGQGYIPPPDDFINESPSFTNGSAFDPLYNSNFQDNPANTLANTPLVPDELIYNPSLYANNSLLAKPSSASSTVVSAQVPAHVSPRPIPSVAIREILAELENTSQDGLIASVPATAELGLSDNVVPVIAGMPPDTEYDTVEPTIYAYAAPEYIDSDGYFYSSMHKKFSNSKISAAYEEGSMFEEVSAYGLPVEAQYYFSEADKRLFRVDDQVTLVASRNDDSAGSLEIEENPIKAYLINLFGSLNDISINQSTLKDSRGESMEVYFVTVNRAGARNLVIYAHQGRIIGVKFIDSKEQVASSPVYVQETTGAAALQTMMESSKKYIDTVVDKGAVGFVPPEAPLVKESLVPAATITPQPAAVPVQLMNKDSGILTAPKQDNGLLKSTVIATANSIITRSMKNPQGTVSVAKSDLKLKMPEPSRLLSETDTIPFNTRAFLLF